MRTTKFSEWLAAKMAEHGETKYKLAKALHLSQSTPANWLAGGRPTTGHRFMVAEHYGVNVEELPREEE